MGQLKRYLFLIFNLILAEFSLGQTNLTIASQQTIQINYPNFKFLAIEIKNRSRLPIEIACINYEDKSKVSGFGLGPKGKATLSIPDKTILQITNENKSNIEVNINPISSPPKKDLTQEKYIKFILKNETAESIPLIIPGVMNPNLSPFSNSGVSLKIGQKIYFKNGLKKYILLTVDQEIIEGKIIKIGSLLSDRKNELGL